MPERACDLQRMVREFVSVWGPFRPSDHGRFLAQLRALLEAYAIAALRHESLPDTEHKHGDPV